MRSLKTTIAALLLASGCATVQVQIDGEEDHGSTFAEDASYPQQMAEVTEEDDDSAFGEHAGYPPQPTDRVPEDQRPSS